MGVDIKLPDLGEGIESGDVLDVLVAEGDTIAKDQNILEIETDKATVEVPASAAGKVTKIHVQSGQTIAIGDILITVDAAVAAETPAASPTPPAAPVADSPAAEEPTKVEATAPSPAAQPAHPPAATRPSAPAAPLPTSAPTASAPPATNGNPPLAAGPAIRRFAREVGVDLTHVAGTGENGRITRDDVLGVVRRASQSVGQSEPAAPAPSPSAPDEQVQVQSAPVAKPEEVTPAVVPDRPARSAASELMGDGQPSLPGDASTDAWGPISVENAAKIRMTIAAKMHESWSTVPRVTNFDDADVTELEGIRQASKEDYSKKGIKLTSMPFVIKAVSMALRENPLVNASFDVSNGQIIYKQYVNVGIAVDTDRGLVVPALRNTDQKSISALAKETALMADRVRKNNFSIDDLRGGTFTISNLGAIGGTYSTPIINVPEVAILLVGRSRNMPIVVDDEIKIRLMMPLSLSYDHRLVDGATAARFLNDVIGYLEAPGRLLLAP